MSDNCVLDLENKILIPQNNLKFLDINISKEWKYSIDIIFESNDINFLNLYLSVFSYIKNIEFFCYRISTIVINKDKNDTIITENQLMNRFLNYNLWEFEDWLRTRITEDKKYSINDNEVVNGIRISFQKNIIEGLNVKYNTNTLKYLKPIYPWKIEVLEQNKINISKEIRLNETIKSLKEKIKLLESKIKDKSD